MRSLFLSVIVLAVGLVSPIQAQQYEFARPVVYSTVAYEPQIQTVSYSSPVQSGAYYAATPIRQANYNPVIEELPGTVDLRDSGQRRGFQHLPYRADNQKQCRSRDCDRDRGWCECRDMFLSCYCGSFTLRCDGSGVAVYQSADCPWAPSTAKGVNLQRFDESPEHVYYQEADSDTRWAFSKSCGSQGHAIWKSKKKLNPLDCDWVCFCYSHERWCR